MENKWQKKRERESKFRVLMRRIRLPLFTVSGVFLVSLVGIPLLLNSIESDALASMPPYTAATAMPLPTEVPKSEATPEPEAVQEGILPEATPEMTPSPTPEMTPDTAAYSTLQQGDEDPMVAEIQVKLTALYYLDSDEPTEQFGSALEAAVRRFQRSHHMKETGVADPLTQQILFSDAAKPYVLLEGYSGEDIRSMQYRLVELGYYFDKTNGYFGTATLRALSAFQTKNELQVTGEADYDTRDLLYSPQARPAIDPTPSPTPTPKPTKTPKPTASPKVTPSPRPNATPSSGATPMPSTTQNAWWDIPGSSNTPAPTPSRTSPPSQQIEQTGSGVSAFIDVALAQQGKPYVLGAEGPDAFDCSGLVYYSLRSAGVKIGRYSARNYARVDEWETIEGKSNLKPGDLLFYKSSGTSDTTITHVGIWLGGNKLVHASSSRSSIVVTNWSSWSDENFLFAKRVF
ncbi:MAG: peptidoglycan-binding protein [Clostridia bacterium]|nr:peptidoglycan-binding protein [Clostridia bacterium]